MFKKVLVPLDGSELAEAVLPYVEHLGKRCTAEVILLQVVARPHVRTTPIQQPSDDMLMALLPESAELEPAKDVAIAQHPIHWEQEMASLQAEAERSLTGAKERLSKVGLKVRVEVLFGQPADKIVEYAMEEEVDLIAMATHGRSGISRWVYGSVAEKVLRGARCATLIIRGNQIPQTTNSRRE